ncbi:MAG: OmpH family outer membrane protein [PVC group bacterium]|nr:OmpH family outer membrane protein [PVC group bacterium]
MKKSLLILGILGFVLLFTQFGFAEEIKIGYISLSQVFQDYKKVIDSNEKLEERKKEVKNMLAGMQDLQKNYDSLSEKGKKEMEVELKAKQEDIRQRTVEVRKDEDRVLREILEDIEKTTGELRKERKFTYILDDRLIIDGPENMNVTDDVIKLLNERYK